MDKLLNSITQKCLQSGLIDEGQTEWLLYSLQCRVMNIGGFCVLIALGLLVAPFPQVLLLNLGLAFLRKRPAYANQAILLCFFTFLRVCVFVCHSPDGL